jgi:hypothetical protein
LGLALAPEPMFGQGFPPVEPDFGPGGVFVLGGAVVGLVDCVVVEVFAAVLGVVGDADALAMPAAAPPVASAPATIVAPSILEIVIGIEPPGVDCWCASDRRRRR